MLPHPLPADDTSSSAWRPPPAVAAVLAGKTTLVIDLDTQGPACIWHDRRKAAGTPMVTNKFSSKHWRRSAKTSTITNPLGEVAEQLSDFRGQVRHHGKPDHLKKHLDRIAILNCHKAELARTLGLRGDIQIEGHWVFNNLVPMRFAWDYMRGTIRLSVFDERDDLSLFGAM